jgi:hypothetical protein
MDVRACLTQAFGLLQVGAIDLRVVLQLPRPLDRSVPVGPALNVPCGVKQEESASTSRSAI